MDLIGSVSTRFLVTNHAAGEIIDVYPEPLARFEAAIAVERCEVGRVEDETAQPLLTPGAAAATRPAGSGSVNAISVTSTVLPALSIESVSMLTVP